MKRQLAAVMLGALALISTWQASGGRVVEAEPLAGRQQDEVVIALRNPGIHQRLGLPDLAVAAGDTQLAEAAKTLADVLWSDIDFEREYYMIPRRSSATIPVTAPDALPFERWSELGAEFVLVASATRTGEEVAIELRMIGVRGEARGRQYFGARYPNCRLQNPRGCAHAIADDFHKQVRALDGVARTKLAFASDRDALRMAGRPSQTQVQGKEIYIADYDGANPMRLTVNRSLNISPTWAPGGGLIAYTSYSSGFPDVYVANLATPGRGLGRPAAGNDRMQNQLAAWSPDGAKLAFMSNRSGNNEIWVVNRDGSDLHQLTNHPANDGAPTWSPDGRQIAFTSDRAGANQLYVMSASGTGAQRLVDQRIDRPTWSALGFIAFTMGGGPNYDIAIWDFNNPGVKILTNGVGSNESPAVAPNGRHIAFVTTRWGGRQQIAVMDRTGQNIRQVTDVGNNTYPNWQPITGR